MFRKMKKKLLPDAPVMRLLALSGGVLAMGLSIKMNVLYWESVQGMSGVVGSLATDLVKPLLLTLVVGDFAARQWGRSLFWSVLLAFCVSLSLFAAYNLRVADIRDKQALRAAELEKRENIRREYEEMRQGTVVSGGLTDPATARRDLAAAEKRVPARIWKRTSACTDATRPSSRNACKQVAALRSALPVIEQKWRIYQQYLRARAAFQALPPLVKPTVSDAARERAEMVFIVAIEILSALGLMLASYQPKNRPPKPRNTVVSGGLPDELHWIEAMKKAAADPDIEGIGFDEKGLMRAPLSRLAGVLEVKSASTAAERLRKLEDTGLLRRHGKGRAVRYELEPA